MGGQKFQYDESGGTFFYFLLSFLALLLIPSTYYWWPRKQKEDPEQNEKECQCGPCKRKKSLMKSNEPWKGTKQLLTKLLIISGWVILACLAYKVSQFDYEYANFDPYEILGVAPGSSEGTIRKAYKKLSLVLHPDKKTGNEKAFLKLTKAYQALTDDESRRNWEKYGNPDGPGAMSFGIALPSWIVEKENSVWVLGLYALVFMIALPTVVGMWWYRSIRYSGDQVLLDTTQTYFYFFHMSPLMTLKRAIMVLGASLEFEKKYNSEIVERPSDNEEVPHLIKQLPNLGEKNREKPLCCSYSIKARALIHAHLNRIPLNPETLEKDQSYILRKCPYLIQEMVSVVSQLIMLAYARRISRLPKIETIENVMKISPMIVQGLWNFKSPLLQIPHVTEENIKYFTSKKRPIKTIQQFAQLKAEERRNVLKFLSDPEYQDVIKVVGAMPLINFQVRTEVIDDEASTVITAGSIVTVTVTLSRQDMRTLFGDDSVQERHCPSDSVQEKEDETGDKEEEKEQKEPKRPVWAKQQHKQKGKKGKGSKKSGGGGSKEKPKKEVAPPPPSKPAGPKKPKEEDPGAGGDTESESEPEEDRSEEEKESSPEEEDDWDKFQIGLSKREKVLEGRSKTSHSVHCPYFPEDKQEYWWVYVSDRKSQTLLTVPYHVTALVDTEEVQLKFTAPRWPGLYTFTVCLRSDSYLGFDQTHDIKMDVKEAPEVPVEHPQWEMSGDEEEGKQEGEPSDMSDYPTDEDVDDD